MPIRQHDRDLLEDLQLRNDDNTEDLRPSAMSPINENGPGSAATESRASVRNPNR